MAQTNKSKAGQANKSTVTKAVEAAKDNPVTAAAIGAGVVAAVAGAAYGASKLRQRDPAAAATDAELASIDPSALPSGTSVQ